MKAVYCDLVYEATGKCIERDVTPIEEEPINEPAFWNWGPHVLCNSDNPDRPFAVEWKDEILLRKKRVHRYSRIYRFKTILKQLIGLDGPKLPEHVLKLVFDNIKNVKTRKHIWNAVRKILKKNKLRKYYVQIAEIIWRLGGPRWTVSSSILNSILNDFNHLHIKFNQGKFFLQRKYFPPLIYTALSLLKKHGVDPPYAIPAARTVRKRKSLDHLFQNFNDLEIKIDVCLQRKLDFIAKNFFVRDKPLEFQPLN